MSRDNSARFSIRKLTIGAVSVMFGAIALGMSTSQVNADEVGSNNADQVTTQVENDKKQQATASVTYFDDTTNKVMGKVATAQGNVGDEIKFTNFSTPEEMISYHEGRGYELVSSNYTTGQKFDSDNAKNQFTIHFKHKMEQVDTENETDWTITQEIHYVDRGTGKHLAPDHVRKATFKRVVYKDSVTWQRTNEQWDKAFVEWSAVTSPIIDGYTAEHATSGKEKVIPPTLLPGNNDTVADIDRDWVVFYNPNDQIAKINYIDDSTNKVIASDSIQGKFGKAIKFANDPATEIAALKKQGYELVSNNFNGQKYVSDDAKNVFEVHFKKEEKKDDSKVTPKPTPEPQPQPKPVIPTPTPSPVLPETPEVQDQPEENPTTEDQPQKEEIAAVKPHATIDEDAVSTAKKSEHVKFVEAVKVVKNVNQIKVSNEKKQESEAALPQAGENENSLVTIGLFILSMGLLSLVGDRKRRN